MTYDIKSQLTVEDVIAIGALPDGSAILAKISRMTYPGEPQVPLAALAYGLVEWAVQQGLTPDATDVARRALVGLRDGSINRSPVTYRTVQGQLNKLASMETDRNLGKPKQL